MCIRDRAQKSFVFVGAPNAGKSTLLNVVQEILLGSENVSNIPWQNLGDRFNRAELFGKLANIFADLPSKSIDDNGMFKALTGEDFITAERKNKDPFSFRPYARFLFSCNEIPRNYGDRSEGFYRRLLIIRFEKSVPKAKRDPNLAEKLAARGRLLVDEGHVQPAGARGAGGGESGGAGSDDDEIHVSVHYSASPGS